MPGSDYIRGYAASVLNIWEDLFTRVMSAFDRQIPLPFSNNAFQSDYAVAKARCIIIIDSLFPSDEEYQELRGYHAKAEAYDQALQLATGGNDPLTKPPPGKLEIPPPAGPKTPDKPGGTVDEIKSLAIWLIAGLLLVKAIDSTSK